MIKKEIKQISIILLLSILLTGCGGVDFRPATTEIQSESQEINQESTIETEQPESEISTSSETETEIGTSTTLPYVETDVTYYAFETLDEKQKQLYEEVCTALTQRKDSIEVSTLRTEELNFIFNCVMNDHPELFYVDGYQYKRYTIGTVVTQLSFVGNYTMDETQIMEYQEQIDQIVMQIFDELPQTEDQYEIVKYLYEYIINETEYDLEAENNQNICSVFLGHRSVCQGYAKAFQYLLQKLGFESTLVTGMANQDGHAWNLVKVNGAFYYVDVTWGDASYSFSEGQMTADTPSINYDYLLVTTEDLCQTHTIDELVPLPVCVETADNYYVREGLFLDTYDELQIQRIFELAYLNQESYVTIKCINDAVYEEVCTKLMEEQKVFQFIMEKGDTIAYTENKQQRTISFWI